MVICNSCGHENPPESIFCEICGARLTASVPIQIPVNQQVNQPFPDQQPFPTQQTNPILPDQQPDPAQSYQQQDRPQSAGQQSQQTPIKTFPLKKLLVVAIPVVIIIAALVVVLSTLGGGSASYKRDFIGLFSDGYSIIISGNNNSKFSIDGEMSSLQRSIDGSKAVVLTDVTDDYGGDLWFVTTSSASKIADDVLSFRMSDSGEGVIYFCDYDASSSSAVLYLYDTRQKSSQKITDDAYYSGANSNVCISPDGKSIAYTSDYDDYEGDFTGYIKLDGKSPAALGKKTYATALANSGKYLYYIKTTGSGERSLYVRSGDNDVRLIRDFTTMDTLLCNDYSEIIYVDRNNDRTFISRKGGERTELTKSTTRGIILPQQSQEIRIYSNMGLIQVCGISSFSNSLIRTDSGIEYINSRFESRRVPGTNSETKTGCVSQDGKTLLFINGNDNLISINPTKANAERVDVARKIRWFVTSSDCKTIYYLDADSDLWYLEGNAQPTRIYENVNQMDLFLGDNRLFFLADYSNRSGTADLFSCKNGKNITRIDEDVSGIFSTPTNMFYLLEDEDLYRSDGNETFSLFLQGVENTYIN